MDTLGIFGNGGNSSDSGTSIRLQGATLRFSPTYSATSNGYIQGEISDNVRSVPGMPIAFAYRRYATSSTSVSHMDEMIYVPIEFISGASSTSLLSVYMWVHTPAGTAQPTMWMPVDIKVTEWGGVDMHTGRGKSALVKSKFTVNTPAQVKLKGSTANAGAQYIGLINWPYTAELKVLSITTE